MNARFKAIAKSGGARKGDRGEFKDLNTVSQKFGVKVFNRVVWQKMLPPNVFRNLINAADGKEKIHPEYADTIAVAMKEWAISLGATHYTHWFHPLTGGSAEKHDSFIDWNTPDKVLETFTGKQLLQGEPDASSFPSGGLRSTYEARGYTGWDPTSPAFVWQAGDGITLCIPSVFYSWTGHVLDAKIPLLRSDKKISDAVMRLLKLTGIEANFAFTTIGIEQEYFVIDRALRDLRPDLLLHGRTVYGAASPKGQELQDHYFTTVKERILSFMHDMESQAIQLGIPVKTRHNEVAPSQHEVAPVFEKSSAAVDHNILLMQIMRKTAASHQLACLLAEKPFYGLNGSGKHCNWSIGTDTGINLLNPTDTPENNLHFLVLLTAILDAIHEHSILLRASIGSSSNDYRLGGHEAPPAIMSVFLGEELESVFENIEKRGAHTSEKRVGKFSLGIPVIPELPKDNTDRNRTSPFAFTGNKFEFRAVGSSSNPGWPITVLNTIVTQSLERIIDEIEANLKNGGDLGAAAIPVLQKYLKKSRPVRFNGDNYSHDWIQEAKRRKLPNITQSIFAFDTYLEQATAAVFEGILTPQELISRYEIVCDQYIQNLDIEVNLMLDMFKTQILPAAFGTQKDQAKTLDELQEVLGETSSLKLQKKVLHDLTEAIAEALKAAKDLEVEREKASKQTKASLKGKAYAEQVFPKMEALRKAADLLEQLSDDQLWQLPKYRELLFLV